MSIFKSRYQKYKDILIFLIYLFGFLFLIFGFFKPLWAKDSSSLDLSKISIPKEFGLVKEVYQSPISDKGSSRIIFHIQDVHANYEAQKNLANILEYLIKDYGINLVLVEGGITDKDFSYIRGWASLEERGEKADELLKEGIISGETYVDIATDFPLKFQGVEDKELYEKNMQIYLKVDTFREEALNLIQRFNEIIERLKKFIYTRQLKRFDKYKRDYKTEETELVEYLEYLNNLASKERIDLQAYPNHIILLKTARLEKDMDFEKVEKERDDLIEQLSDILSKDKMSELIIEILKFKEGKMSPGDFYTYLYELTEQSKLNIRSYKDFNKYIDYIKNFEKLKSEELFKEINKIEDIISNVLCKNDEQKMLFMISKNIFVLDAFLKLKLAPEDFDYYKSNKRDFDIRNWKSFLKRHSKRFHLKATIPEDTSIIDKHFDILEAFYKTAFERDRAFLKNSLKKMEKEKERIAFLITGGFHTKNLARLFMANNISYIVITPRLTQETDEQLYDRILKESYKTRLW